MKSPTPTDPLPPVTTPRPKHTRSRWIALGLTLTLASLLAAAQVSSTSSPEVRAANAPASDAIRTTTTTTSSTGYNRLIVKFKSTANSQAMSAEYNAAAKTRVESMGPTAHLQSGQSAQISLSYLKTIGTDTHVALTSQSMNHSELATVAASLAKDPNVEFAEVDEVVQAHVTPMTPNDSYFGQLWNMMAPSASAGGANFVNAWGLTASSAAVNGSGVIVAVIDTGYRPHADLVGNIVGGYDFVSAALDRDGTPGADSDPTDPGDWSTAGGSCSATSSWHGTHVSGIIGAVGNNNAGVIGGAYGVKILPVRALGICGGYDSDIQAAMLWAAGLSTVGGTTNPNVAKVINLSLGSAAGTACSAGYQTAINSIIAAGIVVVASTGNSSSSTAISSPADCTGVIAVTAHNSAGQSPTFANLGPGTTISAPGVAVCSTLNTGTTTPVPSPGGDTIVAYSGTSMAAPHVAAAAALLYQIKPTITPAEVKTYLTDTARAFPAGSYCAGQSTACGAGMLDAYAAARKLQLALTSGTDHAPVLSTSIPAQTASSNGTVHFTATASDADGDPVTFILSGLPSGASFNNGTGAFTWSNPTAGSYSVTITPTDNITAGTSQTVSITVTQAPSSGGGGGGGGGAISLWELAGLFALAGWATCRRARAPQRHA